MGLVRFLLAIAVLSEHSDSILGLQFMSAGTAVLTFFLISGFYMSLILNEKYTQQKGSYKLFITNRFLRIYPVYWIVLALTILVCIFSRLTTGDPLQLMIYYQYFSTMPFISFAFLLFTNLFIFGQDVASFMRYIADEGFIFSLNGTNAQASWFLLIPQAWSISLELMFYLIVPFFARRKWFLIASVVVVSIALRQILYYNGYNDHSWTLTFFPFQIGFFFTGCLSYEIYKRIKLKKPGRVFMQLIFSAFIIISLSLPWIHLSGSLTYIYFLLTALSIPFIFNLTKANRFDRYIGELSYPIYITHFFTLELCVMLDVSSNFKGVFNLLFSAGLSILLIELISKPIERYRQGRIRM